jgi:predicted RNA-binding protein with RPS1 domain
MIPLLLLFFAQSSAFYNPFTIHRRSTTSTNLMMTSLAKLQKVKERSLERYDLGEPTEDESLLQNYEDIDGLDDEQNKPPVVGDVVTGIIIEMDENGALVEIGGKMSGFIPVKEISLEPVRNIESIYEIGQEVTGEVVGTLKGMPVISMRPTQLIAAWDKAISIRAAGETFETVVTGLNKGGAVCFAFGLDCFLPGSHYIGVLSENIVGQKLKVIPFLNIEPALF